MNFGLLSNADGEPQLPTYKSVAALLERKTGSGVKLLGWTIARTILIAPPMRLVGVPWTKAFLGAALASMMISSLAVARVYRAEGELASAYFKSRKRKRALPPAGMKRIA